MKLYITSALILIISTLEIVLYYKLLRSKGYSVLFDLRFHFIAWYFIYLNCFPLDVLTGLRYDDIINRDLRIVLDGDMGNLVPAMLLLLVGFTGYILSGFFLSRARANTISYNNSCSLRKRSSGINIFLATTLALSISSFLVYYGRVGRLLYYLELDRHMKHVVLSQTRGNYPYYMFIAIYYFYWFTLRHKYKVARSINFISIVFLTLYVIFLLANGVRHEFLFFLPGLLFIYFRFRKFHISRKFLVGVILLAFLAVFMQHIRIVFPIVAQSGVSSSIVYLKEHKEFLFNINNYRLSNVEFGAMYYPVLLYLSKWHGFMAGKSYLNALMWIFPRSFYDIMDATKPPKIVERLVEENAVSGGFGFPITLEAWVNFGLIGALVIPFLVGIILSMVAKFQFSNSLGGIIFYAVALSFPFDLYRSSMAVNATLLINYSIVFITSLLCFACLTQKDPFREQIIGLSDKKLGNVIHKGINP